MKQKLLTLFTLLLTVCSGAWGDNEVSFVGGTASGQINITGGSESQELSSTPVTINIVSPGSKSQNRQIWKDGSTAKNEYAFQLSSGAGNNPNTKYVEISVASGYKIKGVTLRAANGSGTTAGTVYGYCFEGAFSTETGAVKAVGSFAVPGNGGTSDGANVAMTGIANNTRTVRIYKQVKFDSSTNTINGTDGSNNPSSSAISANIASITVTYEATAPAIPTLTGAWKVGGETVTEGAINIGGDVPELSLKVDATSGTPTSGDYTITYSATGDDVVEITGEGSGFTLKNNVTGSATLTATVKTTDNSKFLDAAETYSYVYTVNRVDNSNLDITPATGTYVGKATVTMNYEDGYTVYYTTDGSDPEDEEGTRSVYTAPFDVSSTKTIKAIPYIAADGYGNVVERTYTINAPAAPTFTPGASAVLSGTEITISSTDEGATIYYTTDNTEPSNTNGTEYGADAKPTITEATTIKAISYVNGVASAVAEATYTKIVLDEQTDITGSTEWDWTTVTAGPGELTGTLKNADIIVSNLSKLGVTAITAPSEFDQTGLLINGQYAYRNANGTKLCQVNYLKFNTIVPGILRIEYANTGGNDTRTVCVEVNEGTPEYGTHSSNGNAYSATSEDNKYVIDEFNVSAGTIKIKGVLNNDHSTDKMLRIRKVTFIETVPVTVSSAKYATFSSTKDLDFSGVEGLTAYKATATSENSVTLEDVTGVVPAKTGLLLKGDEATYYIPVSVETPTAVTGNLLQSTATAEYTVTGDETGTAYVFGSLNNVVGFYKAAVGKTIGVGKSWLLVPGTSAKDVEFLSFVFGDEESETTAINAVTTAVENGVRYNLAGQKVGADYKGIVIVNGKKVIIK